jgi:hypothetical protein
MKRRACDFSIDIPIRSDILSSFSSHSSLEAATLAMSSNRDTPPAGRLRGKVSFLQAGREWGLVLPTGRICNDAR